MHERQPALVVQCSGTADVVDAINFAREHGLAVAVRGGGHSIAGLSSIEGGLLIDLASMNGVQVDPEQRTARVQGGALWADVDRETQAFGLVAPGGVVSDTGVAGLTLGGGYGWVRRKFGLSCDSLVEAQVVCADGEVRTASADSNPDLFWALRGGGGNFGVVTSFTFKLHELGPMVAFSATMYPLDDLAEILRNWRAYADRRPDEVTSRRVTITFPANPDMPEAVHDRPVVIIGRRLCRRPGRGDGGHQAAARTRHAPVRHVGSDAVRRCADGLRPAVPARRAAGILEGDLYIDDLSDGAIDTIVARAQNRPARR